MRRIRPVYAVGSLGALSFLLCLGCIVHGDYIHLCRFEGTLVDASSAQPLADASVFLTTRTAVAGNRAKMREASTDSQGHFVVETTIGGGSVTWIGFVPIIRGDWHPPRVHTLYIEVDSGDRLGRLDVPVPEGSQQRLDTGRSRVKLGTLEIQLRQRVESAPRPTVRRLERPMRLRSWHCWTLESLAPRPLSLIDSFVE